MFLVFNYFASINRFIFQYMNGKIQCYAIFKIRLFVITLSNNIFVCDYGIDSM